MPPVLDKNVKFQCKRTFVLILLLVYENICSFLKNMRTWGVFYQKRDYLSIYFDKLER